MSALELRQQIFTLLYEKSAPETAILQLNRILESTPESSQALALKAYALNKLADTRKEWKYSQSALEYAERALLLNPDDEVALISKGWALMNVGRALEALPPLQVATRMYPRNEYGWYNLSWAQYLTGDAASSTESMRRALEISPGNPILRRGKELMERRKVPRHLRRPAIWRGRIR